jgi:undecaprenyl-diphosphatase
VAIGFVVSFVVGAIVVRTMLGFVERHGFAPFAWWRIVVGVLGLALLSRAGGG